MLFNNTEKREKYRRKTKTNNKNGVINFITLCWGNKGFKGFTTPTDQTTIFSSVRLVGID